MSQKLLPLLAFRDVHGPTDDVGVSWWDFIMLHSKAGVVYRGFVELAPTMEPLRGGMLLRDLHAQIADILAVETIGSEH